MVPRPIIIDCDPGADDAIALLLAFASREALQILGITTVAGNVPLALTQRNARAICELAQVTDVPVYAGCPRPLLRSLITAEAVHGRTGLDGITLPAPQLPLQPTHAVNFLIETLLQAETPITLATLGPLTNLAVALVQQPAIQAHIQDVVIMGGAISLGNTTPAAEFNFYVDPHAAAIVLSAGLPITLISLDVTHQAIATPERLAALRALDNPASAAVLGLLAYYGQHDCAKYGLAGPPLHDPCVIAYLLDPSLFTSAPRFVAIETQSEANLGRSVVDYWQVLAQAPNAQVVQTIDADGFFQQLTTALARY